MSRRLIISILAVLILGVVGGTAVFVINRLRGNQPSTTTENPTGSLQESDRGNQQVVNPTGDDDGDGLNNADEALWNTDPKNSDTDGDSYRDGEEVQAEHNPTIPSPGDKLPPGFVPGKDVNPLDSVATQPTAVDQFFVDNLDLSGPKENLTEAYSSRYKEGERSADTVAEFTRSQPVITQLPRPKDEAVLLLPADSAIALSSYLKTAGDLEIYTNTQYIADVVNGLLKENDPSYARGLALKVQLHQEKLIRTPVPPAAQNYHKLLLGYSELYIATLNQMAIWNDDQMKALLAIRQLEEINRRYVPVMQQELNRLRQLNLQNASN